MASRYSPHQIFLTFSCKLSCKLCSVYIKDSLNCATTSDEKSTFSENLPLQTHFLAIFLARKVSRQTDGRKKLQHSFETIKIANTWIHPAEAAIKIPENLCSIKRTSAVQKRQTKNETNVRSSIIVRRKTKREDESWRRKERTTNR